AIAVNSLQIAGAATDAAGVSHDVFWTISGAISERLTTNAVACAPLDMNDGGQLAGSAYVGGVHYACIWTPDAPNGSTGSTRVLLDSPRWPARPRSDRTVVLRLRHQQRRQWRLSSSGRDRHLEQGNGLRRRALDDHPRRQWCSHRSDSPRSRTPQSFAAGGSL